jgi:uncharacterized protein
MSGTNIEIVRATYEAFDRGDLEHIGEWFAEEVEWETPASLPLGGIARGRDAVLGQIARLLQIWSEFSLEPDEYIDAGERVVVRGVQRAVGPGGASQSRYLHVFTLRGGKIVRAEYIADTATAMGALRVHER